MAKNKPPKEDPFNLPKIAFDECYQYDFTERNLKDAAEALGCTPELLLATMFRFGELKKGTVRPIFIPFYR